MLCTGRLVAVCVHNIKDGADKMEECCDRQIHYKPTLTVPCVVSWQLIHTNHHWWEIKRVMSVTKDE